jgi:hypothetical protein
MTEASRDCRDPDDGYVAAMSDVGAPEILILAVAGGFLYGVLWLVREFFRRP